MAKEVLLSGTEDDPKLVGTVAMEGYDDPHIEDFGLIVGKQKPIDVAWFAGLVRQRAVRKQLDQYGFLEVHFEVPEFLQWEGLPEKPLCSFDSEYGSPFEHPAFPTWETLRVGKEYDPTVLIPHCDGDHIALTTATGELRKSVTGLIGRREGLQGTVRAFEAFLDEKGWHSPFREVIAKFLPRFKEVSDSDKLREPSTKGFISSEPVLKLYSDFLDAQWNQEVGIRFNPDANACYGRINQLFQEHSDPEQLYRVQWAKNVLLLVGHVGFHMKVLDDLANLAEDGGLMRKSRLAYLTF